MGFGPSSLNSSGSRSGTNSASQQMPAKVALIGDSRFYLSHYVNGKNSFTKLFGPAHWLQAYSKGRITCPSSLNFGVAGDTTSQILNRLETAVSAIVAAKCKVVFLVCGTNDVSASYPARKTRQNIKRIIRRLQNEGLTVVVVSESPRGGATYAMRDEFNQALIELHKWYEQMAIDMGLRKVNVWDEMVDPATGYTALPGLTSDGLHENPTGGEIWGRKMWQSVQDLFPMEGLLVEDDEAYDATNNPGGSLLANTLFRTVASGQPNADVLPTQGSAYPASFNTSAETLAGVKTTWRLVDNGELGKKLVIRVFGNATQAGNILLTQDIAVSKLSVGDKLRSTCLIESEGAGLGTVLLDHLVVSSSWNSQCDGDKQDASNLYPSQKLGPLSRQTPDLVFSSDITGLTVRFQIQLFAGAVDATVTVSQLGTFKVT